MEESLAEKRRRLAGHANASLDRTTMLENIAEALMLFATATMRHIPKVSVLLERGSADMEGTAEWNVVVCLRDIESLDEETGVEKVAYKQTFSESGPLSEVVGNVYGRVFTWLEDEQRQARSKADKASEALRRMSDQKGKLDTLWSSTDGEEPAEKPSNGHPIGPGRA